MDKAAVLAYCKVRDKQGGWVGCECCFTIVYDVMIVCTSIYKQGLASQSKSQMDHHINILTLILLPDRAVAAPLVRRMFSSSPRDPRYHMLSHISSKFSSPAKTQQHEPRAALFLNRFTRTLTIMYATNGLSEVIGIPAETMRGRSFYYCIAENCLQDAIKCLENAKGNDSIAYLRFWFRDPRIDDHVPPDDDSDEEMTTEMSEDMSEGGVGLGGGSTTSPNSGGSVASTSSNAVRSDGNMDIDQGAGSNESNSRTSSGDSTHPNETHEAIFGESLRAESSASSVAPSPERDHASPARQQAPVDAVELEAVISCASDGLVVCLRKARPMIPHPTHRPSRPTYENGLFAAPWAPEPMLPRLDARAGAGFGQAFAPALGPHAARRGSPVAAGGPNQQDFMNAIRDQAIFAWALTGINGALAEFGHGQPSGESLPSDGLPVWASDPRQSAESDKNGKGWHNGQEMFGASNKSPPDGRLGPGFFGDPGLDRSSASWRVSSADYGFGSGSGNDSAGTSGS